jgi:hypothetical protein
LKEGRTRYRVTLSCGCYWWKEHWTGEMTTRVDTVLHCYAKHAEERISIAPTEMAVAADRQRV